jgi:KDO2-lipid IV(A) lauroyltransferase
MANPPGRWKRFRYRLEWLALVTATRVVPLLPRKACYHLANFLGAIMATLDRHGRRVALANLAAAFGDTMSMSQREEVVRASFQNFARTMLDLLWSPRLNAQNFRDYIEFENIEELSRNTGPERSFIVACYHYSNFEWFSIASAYCGLAGTIIAQEFKNSLLDSIFKKIREQSGHEMIPRERGIIRLYKALRRKGRTALLVDLTVPPDRGAVAIDCFGLKTSVTSAHAWLNQQTGVPIIPVHTEPLPGGRYRIVFHPQIETAGKGVVEIAQACWDSFEPHVRQHPSPWLWMYKHWRYRPLNADRPYPFYAHVYEDFDELLATQRQGEPDDGSDESPSRPNI